MVHMYTRMVLARVHIRSIQYIKHASPKVCFCGLVTPPLSLSTCSEYRAAKSVVDSLKQEQEDCRAKRDVSLWKGRWGYRWGSGTSLPFPVILHSSGFLSASIVNPCTHMDAIQNSHQNVRMRKFSVYW